MTIIQLFRKNSFFTGCASLIVNFDLFAPIRQTNMGSLTVGVNWVPIVGIGKQVKSHVRLWFPVLGPNNLGSWTVVVNLVPMGLESK